MSGLQCQRLRGLVQDCLANHLYTSAAFYADKLVTWSESSPDDVYLLAQSYYASKQYRRAFMLLRHHDLIGQELRFKHLAGKCLAECNEWEECLTVLGDGESDEVPFSFNTQDRHRIGHSINIQAAICLLRGQAYQALENRQRAVMWYKEALARDPYCYDAFSALVDGHMLSNEAELEMMGDMQLMEGDRWLSLMYRCKCKKYMQQDVLEGMLVELQAPGGSQVQRGSEAGLGTPVLQAAGAHLAHQAEEVPTPSVAGETPMHQTCLQSLMLTPSSSSFEGTPMSTSTTPLSHGLNTMNIAAAQTPGTTVSKGAAAGARDAGLLHTPSDTGPQSSLMTGRLCARSVGSDDMDAETPSTPGLGQPHQHQQAAGAQHDGLTPGVCEHIPAVKGCGLGRNVDILTCCADWQFFRGAYEECYQLTSALLEQDPYALQCLPLHLASALQLGKKNELFIRGHKLVEEYPQQAISWYAVGCYYMCTRQYEQARRYFAKATNINSSFAPAWIAFGHAFAAQDERDQAMAAYRTAARLFPGLHLPLLGMGMEYSQMNNMQLAERMLLAAYDLCPSDPVVCHELGVLAYKNNQYAAAALWLRTALDLNRNPGSMLAVEPTIVNFAHCLRKQHSYGEALQWYNKALSINPGQADTYSALAFAHHLMGNLNAAIENYHASLALKPDDTFTVEMLTKAMQEFAQLD